MKLTSYYLHAIDNHNDRPFDGEHSLKILEEILESGELRSSRLTGKENHGWNGLDYISLCDYRRKDNRPYNNNEFYRGWYTAYACYICKSLSFILKKNKINAIKPNLMYPIILDFEALNDMWRLGNCESARYTDFVDEVQVKDRISLDRVRGMTIPIEYMITEHKSDKSDIKPYTIEDLIDYLYEIRRLLKFYKVSSDLYDLETQKLLDTEDTIIETVKENIKIRGSK